MPTLEQSTQPIDRSRLSQDVPTTINTLPPLISSVSSFLLCPLPPIVVYPDTLRQYNRDGIPQFRMIPPKTVI